jgi:hypothetical protein
MLHMAIYNKMTVLPLRYCYRQEQFSLPIGLGTDLTVENVEGLIRPEHFDLWRDYIPKKEREELASTKIGIVHRFSSQEHVGMSEAESQEKVHRAFVFLRLIRPTRERFSNVQLNLQDGQADVFSFGHPSPLTPNCPYLQVFNTFHEEHLEKVIRMLPKFLWFINSPLLYRTRAIRFFEAGYSQIADPLLQFVTWMIGIESFFSEDKGPVRERDLVSKIKDTIGSDTDIFSEAEIGLFPSKPARLRVREVLPDMLRLRNVAVHGVRVPASFDERKTVSPATHETVHYVDVLREAASFVLRNLVLEAVRKTNV